MVYRAGKVHRTETGEGFIYAMFTDVCLQHCTPPSRNRAQRGNQLPMNSGAMQLASARKAKEEIHGRLFDGKKV